MSDSEKTEKKGREPKKNSIPRDEVKKIVHGIPAYEKASFDVIGHKDGVRLAIPKTGGVSRAYFYANGDYSLVPEHPAIKRFSEEERKERRLGGIMAEVEFDDVAKAREALALLVGIVRKAEAPKAKEKKAPKAKAEKKPEASSDQPAAD